MEEQKRQRKSQNMKGNEGPERARAIFERVGLFSLGDALGLIIPLNTIFLGV